MTRPSIHLRYAGSIPPIREQADRSTDIVDARGGLFLAAMAQPPQWVRRLTAGRPYGACYAEGPALVGMMEMALAARDNPLFGGSGFIQDYRRAMERRWDGFERARAFIPGALGWTDWAGCERGLGSIEDGTWLVCTCTSRQECHLAWLAPYLDRAGWAVTLHGRAL